MTQQPPATRPTRGRPAIHGERMPQKSISLPRASWGLLEDAAKRDGCSLSEAVRRLVALHCSNKPG